MSREPAADPDRDVGTLIRARARVAAAVGQAQAEAVRRHRLLGQPIVVWRDGRVAEELPPAAPDDPVPAGR